MNRDVDLDLGPGFAERVLEAADRLVRRRRRHRAIGASLLSVGIATVAVWLDFSASPRAPASDRNPAFASAALQQIDRESGLNPSVSGSAPDALSWFFPDAQPLARYTDDSSDDTDTSAGALFADDE